MYLGYADLGSEGNILSGFSFHLLNYKDEMNLYYAKNHENDGYGYYDPYLINKIKRSEDL